MLNAEDFRDVAAFPCVSSWRHTETLCASVGRVFTTLWVQFLCLTFDQSNSVNFKLTFKPFSHLMQVWNHAIMSTRWVEGQASAVKVRTWNSLGVLAALLSRSSLSWRQVLLTYGEKRLLGSTLSSLPGSGVLRSQTCAGFCFCGATRCFGVLVVC